MDFSALGREPISADQPTGVDVRCHPLFDQLQTEVDKTSLLPSVEGKVEWEKVASFAAEILSCHSKDLLVASYLAVGLTHTRGVEGLAISLKIYRDLLDHHRVGLFPQQARGRVRAVKWWLEKCVPPLKQLQVMIPPGQLAAIEEDLVNLERLLSDWLPEAPSLLVLRDALAEVVGRGQVGKSSPHQPERFGEPAVVADVPEQQEQQQQPDQVDQPMPETAPVSAVSPPILVAVESPPNDFLPDGGDPVARQIRESALLIAEGKLVEAIDGFQRRLPSCRSERERLLWRTALAQVLVEADRTVLALPHLEQAVRDVRRYRLESYEPELALEVLKLAWRGFSSQADPPFSEQAREVLHRIARLDAAEMIRLAKG